jgi:hypothetical protein
LNRIFEFLVVVLEYTNFSRVSTKTDYFNEEFLFCGNLQKYEQKLSYKAEKSNAQNQGTFINHFLAAT